MDIKERIKIADKLKRMNQLVVNGVLCVVVDNMVHVDEDLDNLPNPMPWKTFINQYLNSGRN